MLIWLFKKGLRIDLEKKALPAVKGKERKGQNQTKNAQWGGFGPFPGGKESE